MGFQILKEKKMVSKLENNAKIFQKKREADSLRENNDSKKYLNEKRTNKDQFAAKFPSEKKYTSQIEDEKKMLEAEDKKNKYRIKMSEAEERNKELNGKKSQID